MPNIISHQTNANQNCSEMPLHPHQRDYNKKAGLKTSVDKDVEKRALARCWWACKMAHALWKILAAPQMVKQRVTAGPGNPTPRCTPKRTENLCPHRYLYTHVHTAVFIGAKEWEQPKCPSRNEWINKTWLVYPHSGIPFARTKCRVLMSAAARVDPEDAVLGEGVPEGGQDGE